MTMRGGQWMMTDISTLLTLLYTQVSALSFTQQRKQTQLSLAVSTDSTTDQGGIIAIEIA